MEQFEESVLLCRSVFGWKNVFYQKKNVNRQRESLADLPAKTIAAIEERNTLDIDLYAFARQQFADRIRAEPSVASELDHFRRWNSQFDHMERI